MHIQLRRPPRRRESSQWKIEVGPVSLDETLGRAFEDGLRDLAQLGLDLSFECSICGEHRLSYIACGHDSCPMLPMRELIEGEVV